jgi:shikimate dehydrogenase
MRQTTEISGRTAFTAIFGDPVEHSMSPAMHNAAYAALGMNRAYVAFHVIPQHFRDALRAIRALGIAGVNLTVPHKERTARLLTHLSTEARILAAVNCVINHDGMLQGDNTDAQGLESDLREAGVALDGRSVVIVGAGGAAASAVLTCIRMGVRKIVLCNRTQLRATRLARRFARYATAQRGIISRVTFTTWGLDTLREAATVADATLVINATPMGLKTAGFVEIAYRATPADCLFYDMVYAREPTPFLVPALETGRRTLDGAGMLIHQGELAFALFNGVAPPSGVMRKALMSALGRV